MTITNTKQSLKVSTAAAVLSIFTAVALPQLLHTLGRAIGLGSLLGEMLLPMHLPVLLAGFLAGPYVGGIAGLLSPLISYGLTGMPTSAMLPFMVIELTVYGICAGMLKDAKIPAVLKVLLAQLAGRIVRAAAILIGFYLLDSVIAPAIILTSIAAGLGGILMQLLIIPPVLGRIGNADKAST